MNPNVRNLFGNGAFSELNDLPRQSRPKNNPTRSKSPPYIDPTRLNCKHINTGTRKMARLSPGDVSRASQFWFCASNLAGNVFVGKMMLFSDNALRSKVLGKQHRITSQRFASLNWIRGVTVSTMFAETARHVGLDLG